MQDRETLVVSIWGIHHQDVHSTKSEDLLSEDLSRIAFSSCCLSSGLVFVWMSGVLVKKIELYLMSVGYVSHRKSA